MRHSNPMDAYDGIEADGSQPDREPDDPHAHQRERQDDWEPFQEWESVELSEASEHHDHNVSRFEAGIYCATCAEIIHRDHYGDNQ